MSDIEHILDSLDGTHYRTAKDLRAAFNAIRQQLANEKAHCKQVERGFDKLQQQLAEVQASAISDVNHFRKVAAEYPRECEEQARLNGIGAEREPGLMAQLAECERSNKQLVDANRELSQQFFAVQAELKHEEQRIADLVEDVNRLGHELAAIKQQEPIGCVTTDSMRGYPIGSINFGAHGYMAKAGDLLYTSPQLVIPEGWKLVPVEPTREMADAGADIDPERASVWAAMLAAAPQPMGEKK